MKTVFSNQYETVHVWAQQSQQNGRSSNVFFDGTKIYSYGYHYLLAEFIDHKTVLINDMGYSVTTSKHISIVRGATRQYKQFFVCKTDLTYVYDHIKFYLLPKLAKAKKPGLYTSEILSLWDSLNEYLEYTKANKYKSNPEYKFIKLAVKNINLQPIEFKAKLEKQAKAKAKAEKKQKTIQLQNCLIGFYSYKYGYDTFRHGNFDYLRISKDKTKVETSQGVKVKVSDAIKLYKLIQLGQDVKGYKIDYYTVISVNGTLKIGCHNINMESVHKIGNELLTLNQ